MNIIDLWGKLWDKAISTLARAFLVACAVIMVFGGIWALNNI